jgi:hypothetical protein
MHGWHMARQRKILTITHLLSILPTLHTYPAFRNQTFPLRRTNSRAEHLIVFSTPGSFLFLAVCMDGNAPPSARQSSKELAQHQHHRHIYLLSLPLAVLLGVTFAVYSLLFSYPLTDFVP